MWTEYLAYLGCSDAHQPRLGREVVDGRFVNDHGPHWRKRSMTMQCRMHVDPGSSVATVTQDHSSRWGRTRTQLRHVLVVPPGVPMLIVIRPSVTATTTVRSANAPSSVS